MLRILSARCLLRPLAFRFPTLTPSFPLISHQTFSSFQANKQPEKNKEHPKSPRPTKNIQNLQNPLIPPNPDDYDPDELVNTISPPAFAIYRPNRGHGIALRCGYAMDRVYLHLASEKPQTSGEKKGEDEMDSMFDWETSTLATMLNMYDVSKVLSVLEGREQRVELSTVVEEEDGRPMYKLTVLITPAPSSSTSPATSASAWRPLYSLQLASRLIRPDPIDFAPDTMSISLDAGEIYTLMEHLRRSMIKMFGFEGNELLEDEDESEAEDRNFEEYVDKTKSEIRDNTKTWLSANQEITKGRARTPADDDEVKKFMQELDQDPPRKIPSSPPPKPKPATLGQTKAALKKTPK